MLRFDANLFRIAYAATSGEQTRYYLNGVFVEPHKSGGVTLTATDGHMLFSVHDPKGEADESAIITMSKDMLKFCKPPKTGKHARAGLETIVFITTGAKEAHIAVSGDDYSEPVAVAYDVRIDGSFPDWRRVVPTNIDPEAAHPCFAAKNVGRVGAFSVDLGAHYESGGMVRFVPTGGRDPDGKKYESTSPTLLLWDGIPAFGVLMPIRGSGKPSALPGWFVPFEAPADCETKAA